MRRLLLIGATGLLSMNSFASLNSDKPEDNFFYPKIHVYCDGVYAGYFYNLDYTVGDLLEMATSMCD